MRAAIAALVVCPVRPEHAELRRQVLHLLERRGDLRVERVPAEDGVEPVAERPRGNRPGDEEVEVDRVPGERLERVEEGSRAVVGREGERRPPAAVAPVEPGVGRNRDEAGEGLGMVADVGVDDRQAVDLRRSIARDRDDGRIGQLRHDRRRVARGRRGNRERVRERADQLPALIERHRMRVDLAHLRERDVRRPDEAMVDGQNRLGHDRERRLVEQVVRLGDRARRGSSRSGGRRTAPVPRRPHR